MSIILLAMSLPPVAFQGTRRWTGQTWIAYLVGMGLASCLYLFLRFRLDHLVSRHILFNLGLGLGVGSVGVILSLMIWSTFQVMAEYGWLESKIKKTALWLSRFAYLFLAVLIGFLLFNCFQRLNNGPVGFALGKSREGSEVKINVVLITIDALRADSLTKEVMPKTLEFFQTGQRYQRAYAPSPWTLPTFASLFSSFDPGRLPNPGFGDEPKFVRSTGFWPRFCWLCQF